MSRQRDPIYLDHNAGAPMRPEVRDLMIELLATTGNASSVHQHGRKARARIETAREQVARLCGSKMKSVTFVSGGTEANMTALTPVWQSAGEPNYLSRLVVSAVEHPAVLTGGRFPASNKTVVPVNGDGVVDLEFLEEKVARLEPSLISVMAANNETAVIQPLEAIGEIASRYGHYFHVDAVQAPGRIDIEIDKWQADVVTFSAHKFGGPQGAGAVVVRSSSRTPSALMVGGGQENWRRGGTENVSAISGMGIASELALAEVENVSRLEKLKQRLEAGLKSICSQTVIFGESVPRLANTTFFAVPGVQAETALIAFDLANVSVSSGSACSSGKVSVSHVLSAMGVSEKLARCAIRVSTGWNTSEEDIDRFLEVWPEVVDQLNPSARHQAA